MGGGQIFFPMLTPHICLSLRPMGISFQSDTEQRDPRGISVVRGEPPNAEKMTPKMEGSGGRQALECYHWGLCYSAGLCP